MTEDKSGEFIANLIKNLMQNGFPEKKVSLPLEKLYESAHNRNVNFNKVLTFLSEEKDIAHEKTSTKIVFFRREQASRQAVTDTAGSGNMEELMKLGQQMFGTIPNMDQLNTENLDFGELANKARELVSSMSPEQLRDLQKMVGGLSEEQKEDLLKKAKELGIK